MNEVEAKLIVDDDPEAAGRIRDVLAAAGLKLGPSTVRKTTDTYFDTKDWDLFRYGWTCRVRKGDHESVLAMKKRGQSDNGIARREELESTVDSPPRKTNDIPAGPMRTVCEEATAGRSLEPLFSVQKTRHAFDVVSQSGWKGKAAFDEVSQLLSKKKGELGYREFELEILEGSDDVLNSICELLETKLALTPARLNKFERGLRGMNPGAAYQQREFLFERDTTVTDLGLAYLKRCFEDVQREEPRAWEGIDTEGVHQMRVAIRRIRTALSTLSELFPDRTLKALQREFTWVANSLGVVRDLDVYLGRIRSYSARLIGTDAEALSPYVEHLVGEHRKARRKLIRVLDSKRYLSFKKRFDRLLIEGPTRNEVNHESATVAARRIILRTARKLRRDGDEISKQSPDESLHALRIRGKRLRYVLELFAPVLGSHIDPTIRCVKKLQDCLGNHHDAFVADGKLRAFAQRVPLRTENRGLLLALGELIHVQQIAGKNERNAFFKLWPRFAKEMRPGHLRKKRLSA